MGYQNCSSCTRAVGIATLDFRDLAVISQTECEKKVSHKPGLFEFEWRREDVRGEITSGWRHSLLTGTLGKAGEELWVRFTASRGHPGRYQRRGVRSPDDLSFGIQLSRFHDGDPRMPPLLSPLCLVRLRHFTARPDRHISIKVHEHDQLLSPHAP